ncbi:uncharacterized protein LOC112905321 [Agrilus planipennis]|uniref:Uncharacterized protein LOC112905321 n=1 Tax=Agrilus planipennis TaxID=224129 RepID=A0A7F5RBA8_AGRPL|nr:uncharacterized protein LOC112905321 [Agrilus planipennis]
MCELKKERETELVTSIKDSQRPSRNLANKVNKKDSMQETEPNRTPELDKNDLPIDKIHSKLGKKKGQSKDLALKRFYSLERKLAKNPRIKEEYSNFLEEYEKLGHMTPVEKDDITTPHYYLPHHAVLKESSETTKLRVVFDGFAKTTSVLNSRPLSPLSSDINDPEPLTPAHFLIGRKLTSPPQPDLSEISDNRLSKYQHVQKMVQHFWQRWCKEYIAELQVRHRWKVSRDNMLAKDTLVIVQEEQLPPFKWRTGRVIGLHPGIDGVIRVVTIKLPNGTVIKRAVNKVCVLPMQN